MNTGRHPVAAATAVIAMTVALAACGTGSKSTSSASSSSATHGAASSQSSASEANTPSAKDAPSAPLGADACVEVTQANLDLAAANSKDAARAAADILEKYNPPADAKEAIEHFVGTGGAQIDDPDFDKYNKRVDQWVKEVCPG